MAIANRLLGLLFGGNASGTGSSSSGLLLLRNGTDHLILGHV